jgi:hypothetical protein
MRLPVLFALASVLLVTSGCKTACRQLSEKQCDCTTNSNARTQCLQNAATKETTWPPTADDELKCQDLIETCDCRLVDTQAGKERCGLANPET